MSLNWCMQKQWNQVLQCCCFSHQYSCWHVCEYLVSSDGQQRSWKMPRHVSVYIESPLANIGPASATLSHFVPPPSRLWGALVSLSSAKPALNHLQFVRGLHGQPRPESTALQSLVKHSFICLWEVCMDSQNEKALPSNPWSNTASSVCERSAWTAKTKKHCPPVADQTQPHLWLFTYVVGNSNSSRWLVTSVNLSGIREKEWNVNVVQKNAALWGPLTMLPAIMNGHFRLLKYTLPINTSNRLCTTQAVKVYPAYKH